MKFCVPFLLLLLFDTLQGSTLSHVRKVRSLNTTLQTNFNGTYERRNPCTNAEIESSSYIASHEFHHHTNEDNWSDYTHKCSSIISGFLQAIGNLVRFNNKQNGLFNFHINTSISQKQIGDRKAGKCCENMPTILIEATDCQVTPKTNTEAEGKYDGPVCLLNKRKKAGPRKVTQTASCEQNSDKVNPSIINSNKIISQNEFQETEKQTWNPVQTSSGDISEPLNVEGPQVVSNCIAQPANEQTSAEFSTPTTTLSQSEPQVIPVTPSYEPPQPNFGSGNSPGFQAESFENANEQENFNPPADTPNMPFAPQPSFSGIPPQPIVPISNEEEINQNQLPPVLSNQQGYPAVYPPQPSNNNLDGQVPGNQMPELLPPSQTEGIPQGGPGFPQNSPAFIPTYNGQNPNLKFPGNYPPPPQQASPMKNSFELPPTDFNNEPSQVGFTKTQAQGQISDMTETVDSFTPDQQQPVTPKQTETAYYNDGPMNYNQAPTVPSQEIQPEFLPPKPLFLPSESQQQLPEYPSEIATNEQPPMRPTEVLPSDSVAFSDSPVIPNGGVGNTFNLPVANSFEPVVPSNSQLPTAPALTAPQDRPLEQQYTTPSSVESTYQSQRERIPEFQVLPNQMPGPIEMSDNPPISNRPGPNTFIQPVPVGSIPSSNNFPEQARDEFEVPQQLDSNDLRPVESTPSQPIPTLGPQSSPYFTQQLPRKEMFGPVPQNFQRIVPVDAVPVQSSPVVGPTNDIASQTAVEDSQFDYPTSTERPEEPSVSGLVPNNIGNQLSELTTNNKPVLNSNDFQPETKSYFTEPSDRNLDYTTQTSFYDSIPATYKSELESQPGLIPNVQNLPERPIAPVPEQAFPPSAETFPATPELPSPAPDVTNTEPYSEQIRPEFGSTPTNPEIVNPPRNDFQMFSRRPNPRFIPREQYFGNDRQTVAMQQPNPIPEISNPLNTNQPPLENNPVVPEQQQPQFNPNQTGDIQQPLPETEAISQPFAQMAAQQVYETTRSETSEFTSSVPLQDQRITPAYPQSPIQAGVTNYDVQPGNQAPIQPDVPNYDVQSGNQAPIQPDVPNYNGQPGFQPPVQDVPNYDVQPGNQAPIQPDVPNYDVQSGNQAPIQPDVPNYNGQPGFQPPVQDVTNYEVQPGNQAPIQPDVPNYNGQPGNQAPIQPDVPNYDVQPGNQAPIQPDVPNYNGQPGNQAPIQPYVPNYNGQPGFQPPIQDVPNYDVQPGNQAPIQPDVPNYDVQPGNQAPIQPDVPNYNGQPGNQAPIQPYVPNYNGQPGFQPPIQDVPNYDVQPGNQAPIQPDVPNYNGQPGNQAPIQQGVPNYDVQPGFQAPIQPDVPSYDVQAGNQAPIQPDVPNYNGQPGDQAPIEQGVPNYDDQPGNQAPIQQDVQPGFQAPIQQDVQPGFQAPIQQDVQPGFQPPVQDVPNYDVQPGNQAPIQQGVPNYDVQPGFQAPIQQDVQPGFQAPIQQDVQPGFQAPIQQDVQPGFQPPVQDVPNYDVQPGNQAPIQPDVPNYNGQPGNQAPIQQGVPNYDVQPGFQAPIQPDVPSYDVQPGNQTPIQPDVPNYNGQTGFQPPVQDVRNYDVQPGNQSPIQPDVPNYDGELGFQPPVQDVPNYDVQSGNQAPMKPDVPNYDGQPGFQAPIQPDVPNFNGQTGFQPPVQDVRNYDVQPGNQIQPDVPNYDGQPGFQPPVRRIPDVPNYEMQPGNQPPNVASYYPDGSSAENYREPPQSENQPFQADSQPLLPYQAPGTQIPSAESQEQIINTETASTESVSNTDLVSTVPSAALGAGDSLPKEYPSVEQQSTGFDGSQMPQQNYPNPGFPSPQAPVYPPATQNIASQYFPGQSDSSLNYDGVQPEQQIPSNDQFPPRTDSNLQPVTFPPQIGPVNPQNGVNPNGFQTFVPPAPPQQTAATPFPFVPLKTNPENPQVNSFSVGSETSTAPEVQAQGMNNVMLNPYQPSGVGQPEPQDVNTQDQFTRAVPIQFATESSGEVTTDYPDQYRPRPSEDNFSGVPGVQTTNQMLTSIDEYQNPGPTPQEPLSYFQERPDDVAQTTPPPFQADQFLTSTQIQSEYVQNNAAMYSPNLAHRPQPQPSFDNLTEFPGDKTAGSTTQTPLPSEIKPETFGSQPPRQTALTETNIPDTDNTKTLDRQPNSGTSAYLGPQIYPNFDVPAPALNYPRQDRPSFPPTADSITRDMTYQTTVPAFTPSLTVPTYGINPIEMVFNSNSSYSSTAMIPGEGLEKQPFRQASALIASPQPQPTTVKYNEQIIIPQYQMPTASNQEPQASLKYADQNSGDNTKEGLLDSVARTYRGPQEAMSTVPQPQYQTTPLRSQFPPSNVEFNSENIGRPFLPGQKQLVPVTPSFEQEDSSNSKTTTKIVQEVLTTTDFPVELESPSAEDKLAHVDKLLNNNTRIQEYDQRMGQGPQIQFSPTETRVVPESLVTPPTPFQYPLAIQNQPQMQTFFLTRSEQTETNSSTSRPSPFQEDKIQVQPQFQSSPSTDVREIIAESSVISPLPIPQQIYTQPQTQDQLFSSTISREIITDSLVTPPPPFQSQIQDQPQLNREGFDSTNFREVVTEPPITIPPPFEQQTDAQSQTELQPFSSTTSREVITDSFVTLPPPFEPQTVVQARPRLQSFPLTNTKEGIADSLPLPLPQQINVQTQLQPYSLTISRESETDSLATSPPPFQAQIEGQPQFQVTGSSNREDLAVNPAIPPLPLQQEIEIQPQSQLQTFSSTIMKEETTVPSVPSIQPTQSQIAVRPPFQFQSFPSTNRRIGTTDSLVPPPSFDQQIDAQSQTELQSFSSTTSREVITDSFVTPPHPFQPQTVVQPQPQLQSLPSANTKEILAESSINPPPFEPQTEDQLQPELQTLSSTNLREITADSPVIPPLPLPQQINVQTRLQPYSLTISRERVTDSLVDQPAPFQSQIEAQPQPQVEEFDSTNIREDTIAPPFTTPPPFQQDTDVRTQTKLQQFSSTISREIVSDSLKGQPSPSQVQIEVQDQPQLEEFDSRNIREDVAVPPLTPPAAFQQENDQLQAEHQTSSSTISREIVTDSFVTPPLPFQPQIEDQSQSQTEEFYTANIREDTTASPDTPQPPIQSNILVQPQLQFQSFPSTSSLVPPTLFQPQNQIQPQPQPEELDSTNIREDVAVNPPTPPPPFQKETVVQPFSATMSKEIVTDSLLTQPPPVQSQIVDRPQLQFQSFPSTNIRVAPTDSFVPPPPLRSQIQVQPQSNLERFDSTSIRQVVTEPPVITTSPFQLKPDTRPQTESFSSTISKEVVADTFVSPPIPLQAQIQDRPQSQVDEFDSTNIREDITVPPVSSIQSVQPQIVVPPQRQFQSFSSTNRRVGTTDSLVPPPPFDQQIDAQPQTELQSFSLTKSREVITDSFVTPPHPFQSQTVVQPQPQLQSFPSANTKEIIAESSINPPLSLPQQVNVQTRLQPYSLTISRETITDSLVGQPPPFQLQIQDQPQAQVKQFDSANIRENTTALPIIPASPFQQLTNAQAQPPLQAFPSTNMREITTNPKFSFVSPIQPQIQVLPQPNLEGFGSTNFTESVTESRVITTPPIEQQTEVQSQTQLQPFSSTISREVVTDSVVSRPPPFQSQFQVRPQPNLEGFDSTNIREIVTEPPVGTTSPLELKTDARPQTDLQPFSATMSKEIITDSLLTPSLPIQRQIVDQSQLQFQSFPSTNKRVVTTDSLLPSPPPIQPQIQFRPQPQPEELYSTNIREGVAVSPATPPPPFQKETVVQPFSTTVSKEIVTDSLLTPPPPVQPQIVVQPQLQFQSFPVSNIRVVTTNSLMPPTPVQPKIQVPPESNLEGFESTNIQEVMIEPSLTVPPPLQQQNDAQPQTVLQPYSSSTSRELITDSIVTPPSPFPPQIQVLPQQQFQTISSTNTREDIADSPVTVQPVFEQQTNDLPQIQLQPFSSTMSKETVTDSLVSQTSPLQPQNEVQSEPQFLPPSPNMSGIMSDSATSQPPPIQQQLENQPQPTLQLISSRKITTGPFVSPPPPFPRRMEVRPQPELKTFSSVVPATSYVYPPTLLQQAVETQRQSDLRNFSSRNTTATVSDSPVGNSVSVQGVREQVQNQKHTFPTRNREVAIAPLANPSAKLEKHVGRELKTQSTRYTTTKTKEVITESILPTSESLYAETGKDGQLKAVEIRSDSEGNRGKKTTQVVEETIASDFPPTTEFSSLEDEFILADKLLNNSTPIVNTTSYIEVSPFGRNSEKVITVVDEPAEQISVNRKSKNSSKLTPVNYDPKHLQSGAANNPSSPLRGSTVSPDFQTSERDVYTPATSSDYQDDYEEASQWNPLLHTLETHLNFPLHEPSRVPSTTPGPRRASPLPLLSHFNPTSPVKTGRRNSWPNLEIIKNSGSSGQEVKTGPRHDPPVPVFNPTDPSNGPDPLKELILKNHELVLKNSPNVMAAEPRSENF